MFTPSGLRSAQRGLDVLLMTTDFSGRLRSYSRQLGSYSLQPTFPKIVMMNLAQISA